MEADETQLALTSLAPEIAFGNWYEDKWMGPYLRGQFRLSSGDWRLIVAAYCPADETHPIKLLVRRGPNRVLAEEDVAPGTLQRLSFDLQVDAAAGPLDISLRTDRLCRSAGEDARPRGIVLAEFSIHHVGPASPSAK